MITQTKSAKDLSLDDPLEAGLLAKSKEEETTRPWYILPCIVGCQFAGTALWFAGNAILPNLIESWATVDEKSTGLLASSVNFGFIVGTLVFAIFSIADRFLPTIVFMICALSGAACNAILPALNSSQSLIGLVILRVSTGFFLAGIYPVGMKIASDWYGPSGLGGALGWLVGALAFGSSFPFLLKQIPQPWQALIWEVSALAAIGAVIIGCLPNGPYRQAAVKKPKPSLICGLFKNAKFTAATVAYWGHMWELYAFWAWTPRVWTAYLADQNNDTWSASFVTFLVIAVGAIGCIVGGQLSLKFGSAPVAFYSLAISGFLCLVSPALYLAPVGVMFAGYLVWGMAVVADSPQFSSLIAQSVPGEAVGTALTFANCIGFAITIGSIYLLEVPIPEQYLFLLLAPGPMLGIGCLWIYHL